MPAAEKVLKGIICVASKWFIKQNMEYEQKDIELSSQTILTDLST